MRRAGVKGQANHGRSFVGLEAYSVVDHPSAIACPFVIQWTLSKIRYPGMDDPLRHPQKETERPTGPDRSRAPRVRRTLAGLRASLAETTQTAPASAACARGRTQTRPADGGGQVALHPGVHEDLSPPDRAGASVWDEPVKCEPLHSAVITRLGANVGQTGRDARARR